MPPCWGRAQQGRVVSVSCGICRAADLRPKLLFPHGTSTWLAASARCWLRFQLGLSVGELYVASLCGGLASSQCTKQVPSVRSKIQEMDWLWKKPNFIFYRLLLLRQSYDSGFRIDDISFMSWCDKVFWKPCFKMSIAAPWFDLKIPSARNIPFTLTPTLPQEKITDFSKASL